MTFASREEGGRRLGQYLADRRVQGDLVLGLPRGGVIVAAEVASMLRLPLDVLVVRKIGHPWYREFAVGAMAENGVVLLDGAAVSANSLVRDELDVVIAEEAERLRAYQAKFHRAAPIDRRDKTVLIVDDGLATGATTEVAVKAARTQGVRGVMVAAPVASLSAVERLGAVADDVMVLLIDPEFDAVGSYYAEFSQTTDEEVLKLLQANERATTHQHA